MSSKNTSENDHAGADAPHRVSLLTIPHYSTADDTNDSCLQVFETYIRPLLKDNLQQELVDWKTQGSECHFFLKEPTEKKEDD